MEENKELQEVLTLEGLEHLWNKLKTKLATADLSNVESDVLREALEECGYSPDGLASIGVLSIDENGTVSIENQLAKVGEGGATLEGYATEEYVDTTVENAIGAAIGGSY